MGMCLDNEDCSISKSHSELASAQICGIPLQGIIIEGAVRNPEPDWRKIIAQLR